ncbi:hypothetical protein E2P81_ATG00770 [Venturia nashicola]|uniref:Uncharacterized protein n=1 Tax=Venturia nashicola TaxID=86259 RepID=A0A4Z1PQC0_9PEZI|nr:hypothetical protein E6O75_ATG00788 [Venturia nashicola]TLD38227.1 hypothetical protein E2P81_ATG00770 [Venturia nashicola]
MRLGTALVAIAALSLHCARTFRYCQLEPPSFDKAFEKGEKLIAAIKNPPNKDDLPISSLLYFKKCCGHVSQYQVLDSNISEDADLPARRFGWDLTHPWHYTKYFIKDGESSEDVSTTAFDDIPPLEKKDLPHSDIWTYNYGDMFKTGEHLKYVMRNNIINDETEPILLAARKLLAPDAGRFDVVEVDRESDNIAEREAFIALAWSTLFRIITDRHNMFEFRQVTKVWLCGKQRGQCSISDFCLTMMVWELGEHEDRPAPFGGFDHCDRKRSPDKNCRGVGSWLVRKEKHGSRAPGVWAGKDSNQRDHDDGELKKTHINAFTSFPMLFQTSPTDDYLTPVHVKRKGG